MSRIYKFIDKLALKIKGVDLTMVDREREIMKQKIDKQKAAIKAAQEAIKPEK